jgi:hypothetical protein
VLKQWEGRFAGNAIRHKPRVYPVYPGFWISLPDVRKEALADEAAQDRPEIPVPHQGSSRLNAKFFRFIFVPFGSGLIH